MAEPLVRTACEDHEAAACVGQTSALKTLRDGAKTQDTFCTLDWTVQLLTLLFV
jgi:hypothetical protein